LTTPWKREIVRRPRKRRRVTNIRMTQYLGRNVSDLLGAVPFGDWPVERHVEEGLDEPRVYYVLKDGVLELFCDPDERIKAIFVRAETCGGVGLSDVPFDFTRRQVLEHFGTASESGDRTKDPILGESGAWDRFARPGYAVHVEYRTDSDAVKQITLMRPDTVPN
jgi:hypothetical protein